MAWSRLYGRQQELVGPASRRCELFKSLTPLIAFSPQVIIDTTSVDLCHQHPAGQTWPLPQKLSFWGGADALHFIRR